MAHFGLFWPFRPPASRPVFRNGWEGSQRVRTARAAGAEIEATDQGSGTIDRLGLLGSRRARYDFRPAPSDPISTFAYPRITAAIGVDDVPHFASRWHRAGAAVGL
jgi:hypothetical protein